MEKRSLLACDEEIVESLRADFKVLGLDDVGGSSRTMKRRLRRT